MGGVSKDPKNGGHFVPLGQEKVKVTDEKIMGYSVSGRVFTSQPSHSMSQPVHRLARSRQFPQQRGSTQNNAAISNPQEG